MVISKIVLSLIGLSVGVTGTLVSAPAATAPVTDTAIVTVSGAAGVLSDN